MGVLGDHVIEQSPCGLGRGDVDEHRGGAVLGRQRSQLSGGEDRPAGADGDEQIRRCAGRIANSARPGATRRKDTSGRVEPTADSGRHAVILCRGSARPGAPAAHYVGHGVQALPCSSETTSLPAA